MLVSRVRQTVVERRLFAPGARILVAVSGGPDSAVLLDVLWRLRAELRTTLVAASIDHGLRADASRDVETARTLAEKLAVPFHALRVEVPRDAGSLQAAARSARYAALVALAAEEGAAAIAVGHTREDQAETVLARLLRGAGLRGLAGIAPKRADGVVRPLYDCARADVLAWAEREGLPFIHDPSNADPRYLRVRIRGELLPKLVAEDASIARHLAELADEARATSAVVERRARRMLGKATKLGTDAPPLAALAALDAPTRGAALRAVLAAAGIRATRSHLGALDRLVRTSRGEVRLPGDRIAVVSRAATLEIRARGPDAPYREESAGPTFSADEDDS